MIIHPARDWRIAAGRAGSEAAAPWRWRQVLRRALSASLPRRLLLTRGPAGNSGRLYLTFDDGPHPVQTPRILDLLRSHGAIATFFVIGQNARRRPELLRRIVDEGHAIGHHSFSHAEPHLTSARRLMAEIEETQDDITAATGRRTRLFRPPHGKVTSCKLWALWRAGFTVVLWNRDPKDFARGSADELRQWLRCRPLSAGDVVLLHDTVSHTAEVLPELIASARESGLTFATVDELLS